VGRLAAVLSRIGRRLPALRLCDHHARRAGQHAACGTGGCGDPHPEAPGEALAKPGLEGWPQAQCAPLALRDARRAKARRAPQGEGSAHALIFATSASDTSKFA
jgi:hypothetical protein